MTHDDPTARTARYLTGGRGGLVGFELKTGDPDAGARFIDALQMIYHVANIGDTRTLAIHPASSTHQQLSPEDQLATGVTPRSEEHTSELQSLMRISYAVFCLKKKHQTHHINHRASHP